MKKLVLILMSLALSAAPASAQLFCKKNCCQQYQIVEEVCYKEVVRKYAVPVPDIKKVTHWVYDNRTEDFAVPCCTWPGCCKKCGDCSPDCGPCVKCGKVCCRAPLIKRLIIEEVPITKCEVECVVERVACVTYRKVPIGCGAPEVAPGTFPPGGIPPGDVIVPQPETIPVMPRTQTIAPHQAPAIETEPAPRPHEVGAN